MIRDWPFLIPVIRDFILLFLVMRDCYLLFHVIGKTDILTSRDSCLTFRISRDTWSEPPNTGLKEVLLSLTKRVQWLLLSSTGQTILSNFDKSICKI